MSSIEELREAILAVHQPDQLRMALRDVADIDIDFYDHRNFEGKVDSLLRDIKKQGTAPAVLTGLASRLPDQPEFRQFITDYLATLSQTPVKDALTRLKNGLKAGTGTIAVSIKNNVAVFFVAMLLGGAITTTAAWLLVPYINVIDNKVESVVIQVLDETGEVTDITNIQYRDSLGNPKDAIRKGVNLLTIPLNQINTQHALKFVLNRDSSKLLNDEKLRRKRPSDFEFEITSIKYPSTTSKELLINIRMKIKTESGPGG